MSEENTATTEEELPTKEALLATNEAEEATEDVVTELSEEEQSAIEKGWNPEGVEGKKHLSAEEFLDRQKLYDDLHSLKRQNKRLQGDIENINKYQEQIRDDERKKVVAELKIQKRDALEEGDHDRVVEIDDRLADEREKAKAEKTEVKSNEDFEEWIAENDWYQNDTELREEADIYGEVYWAKNPTKTRDQVYKAVSSHIKRSYKEKFENPKRAKASPVDSGTNSGTQKKPAKSKYSAKDLPSDQRSIMKTILRTTKGLTEEQYLKDYFSMND